MSSRMWLSASVLAVGVAAGLPSGRGRRFEAGGLLLRDAQDPGGRSGPRPGPGLAGGRRQDGRRHAPPSRDLGRGPKRSWSASARRWPWAAPTGRLLTEARDLAAAAPGEAPPLRDAKRPPTAPAGPVLRQGALSGKRVYEEALDALKAAVPEQVVDPAGYYFHKAVAEHALVMKREASTSIARLLDDVSDAPEPPRWSPP